LVAQRPFNTALDIMVSLFAKLRAWWNREPLPSPVFPDGTELTEMEGFAPEGFVSGVQILNDATTPMWDVVELLMGTLGMSKDDAVKIMLQIHLKGGALLRMSTSAEASERAGALSSEALARSLPLRVKRVGVGVDV
jgi:ATP-dependent Clp protease adapter protein ClpS